MRPLVHTRSKVFSMSRKIEAVWTSLFIFWLILKEQLIILVKDSKMLLGRNLRAVLVMWSSPGAFFLRSLWMIC
jgi:hypothetical protein